VTFALLFLSQIKRKSVMWIVFAQCGALPRPLSTVWENVTSTTDPSGNSTLYGYDSSGNVTTQFAPLTDSAAAITAYTYNSFGEVLAMTDPLGNVTSNSYDTHGNLLTVTTPRPNGSTSASVTHFAYNSLGELTQITDPLNHVTTMTYTPAGLIATITDPQSHVTTYTYDSRGNRTSVTDALSHVTSFTYDAGNRLLSPRTRSYDTRVLLAGGWRTLPKFVPACAVTPDLPSSLNKT